MLNHELKMKEIRKSKGISQQSLAKELNTTQQMVSKYEMHVDSPSVSRLVEIAKILDVTLDEPALFLWFDLLCWLCFRSHICLYPALHQIAREI